MGTSQRKEAVDYFGAIAIAPEAPSEESFCERLRYFQKGICSGSELRNVALPVVRLLIESNAKTGRLQWLFHTATVLLEKTLTTSASVDTAVPAVLFLVELVLRNVLLEMHGNSVELLQLLEGSAGRNPTTMSQDSGAALCGVLMDYVVKVPLTLDTAVVHHGTIRLLLTMTSSALHHTTDFREDRIDVFTEMIMSSTILSAFLNVLLQRLSEWGRGLAVDANSTALLLYAEGQAPGLMSLFGWLGGSSSTVPTKEEETPIVTRKGIPSTQLLHKSARTGEMVGRQSAELVAILVAHQKGNGRNPAIECIKTMVSTKELSFGVLLKAIANKIVICPALCMVLYVFLQEHSTFLREVNASAPGAVVDVAQSMAHLLFLVSTSVPSVEEEKRKGPGAEAASEPTAITVERDPLSPLMMGNIVAELIQYAYPFMGFMTSSLVLILSEERVVNELMCDAVRSPAFAEKRLPKTLSVASQMLFALCSAITRAVFEANTALVDVLIPVLGNLSTFVHDMELQVAQRMLQLVLFLLKRIRWADEAYRPSSTEAAEANAQADPSSVKALGDGWARQLRGVLECVENMIIRGGDRHNESLVYEVLYNMDRLLPQGSPSTAAAGEPGAASASVPIDTDDGSGIDPAAKPADGAPEVGLFESEIRPAVNSLHRVVQRCETEVFNSPNVGNVQEILRIIRQSMSTASTETAPSEEMEVRGRETSSVVSRATTQDVELVFTYEESPHSYDFFGPFTWSTLLSEARRPGGILWCTQVSELALFPQ